MSSLHRQTVITVNRDITQMKEWQFFECNNQGIATTGVTIMNVKVNLKRQTIV